VEALVKIAEDGWHAVQRWIDVHSFELDFEGTIPSQYMADVLVPRWSTTNFAWLGGHFSRDDDAGNEWGTHLRALRWKVWPGIFDRSTVKESSTSAPRQLHNYRIHVELRDLPILADRSLFLVTSRVAVSMQTPQYGNLLSEAALGM
jgi:hypothetical protein